VRGRVCLIGLACFLIPIGLAIFLIILVKGSLYKRTWFIRASFVTWAYTKPTNNELVVKGAYGADCNSWWVGLN
jgi:hypothetical protein